MNSFMKKGAALMLLGACLAMSSLCPVQAEEVVSISGNDSGEGYSAESGTVLGEDIGGGVSSDAEAADSIGADMEAAESTEENTVASESIGLDIIIDAATEAMEPGEADRNMEEGQEVLDELAAAEGLVDAGCSDRTVITEAFTQLYGLYHYEPTSSFVVSVPASISLSENLEEDRIEGEIPFTVRYLFPDNTYQLSVTVDEGSLILQDADSGKTISLSAQTEGTAWDVGSSAAVDAEGFYNGTGKISLSGERSAGDWEGTLRLDISCSQ